VVNWRCGVGSGFEVEASALTATFLAAAMAQAQARRMPQRRRAVSIGAARQTARAAVEEDFAMAWRRRELNSSSGRR
jgi:hypothetical protein